MSETEFFFPLNKINEEGRLVFGTATQEIPDRSGEIADYDETKKAFQKWSEECRKMSAGKSHGNVREMHGKNAVGILQSIIYNDGIKSIDVVAKVVDDQAWAKCLSGVLCGFSIGGSYSRKWKDGEHTRYAPKLSELSLVDRPCVPTATIRDLKKIEIDQVIEKADGTIEQRELVVEEGIFEDIAKASDDPDDKDPESDEEDEESEDDGDKDDARKADGFIAFDQALPPGYVPFDQALGKAYDESRHKRDESGRWTSYAGTGAAVGAATLPAANAADALRHHYMGAPRVANPTIIGRLSSPDLARMARTRSFGGDELEMRQAAVENARAATPWEKKLGIGEKLAINQYQEVTGHAQASAMLRGDTPNRNWFRGLLEETRHLNPIYGRAVISGTDSALAGAQLGEDTTMFRGVTGAYADHLASLKPGTVVHDEGFTSATMSRPVANDFSRTGYDDPMMGTRWQKKPSKEGVVVELKVPKGFNAAPVSGMTGEQHLTQNEVVMPRGTRYVIDEVAHEGGQRIVRARVLPESGKAFSRAYALRGLGRGTVGSAIGGAVAGGLAGLGIYNASRAGGGGDGARKADGFIAFDEALPRGYEPFDAALAKRQFSRDDHGRFAAQADDIHSDGLRHANRKVAPTGWRPRFKEHIADPDDPDWHEAYQEHTLKRVNAIRNKDARWEVAKYVSNRYNGALAQTWNHELGAGEQRYRDHTVATALGALGGGVAGGYGALLAAERAGLHQHSGLAGLAGAGAGALLGYHVTRAATKADGYDPFDAALAKAFDESRHERDDKGRFARDAAFVGGGLGAAGAAASVIATIGSRAGRGKGLRLVPTIGRHEEEHIADAARQVIGHYAALPRRAMALGAAAAAGGAIAGGAAGAGIGRAVDNPKKNDRVFLRDAAAGLLPGAAAGAATIAGLRRPLASMAEARIAQMQRRHKDFLRNAALGWSMRPPPGPRPGGRSPAVALIGKADGYVAFDEAMPAGYVPFDDAISKAAGDSDV